jgi:hypothetical protein
LLKIAYGPLLGPAMLIGAAVEAGHHVSLLDLNAVWIRERLRAPTELKKRTFVGDHDRPDALGALHNEFVEKLSTDEVRGTHERILSAAQRLATDDFGAWTREQLRRASLCPEVIGVSVMYRDQVESALAMTILARSLWPKALVVWGGAHVTALRDEIVSDVRYGCGGLIDRFVFGYAERTWCSLLDAVDRRAALPDEAARAGGGQWLRAVEDLSVVPVFHDLGGYAATRLTLPIQSSRGCTYGVCSYCTYPSIEGSPRELPWSAIDPVIEYAARVNACMSFKDSLVQGSRLEVLAERIAGRAPWSACTKLDARLPDRLARLALGGCKTLEVGLETLDRRAQGMILKRQTAGTFFDFLDAATAANIAVVVNYITGLPDSDLLEEARSKSLAEHTLAIRRPALVSKLEHNRFELERLARMAQLPERFGMRITHSAPWSSVLEWVPSARLVSIGRRR